MNYPLIPSVCTHFLDEDSILCPEDLDHLDLLTKEFNSFLKRKMKKSKGNIQTKIQINYTSQTQKKMNLNVPLIKARSHDYEIFTTDVVSTSKPTMSGIHPFQILV